MPLNYTFYQDSPAPALTTTPRQARAQRRTRDEPLRILDGVTPMSAPSQSQPRLVSLAPDARRDTHLRVLDTEGNVMAILNAGMRASALRGRADIGAVLVTLDGVTRTCDMAPALEWIDAASHIGVSATVKNGIPVCTLSDMNAGVTTADVWGLLPGQRCVYVTDQKGHAGLECT